MKTYGLYDTKYFEECVCLGTIKDISNYLHCSTNSIRSYITHRKKGERFGYLRKRYELVEILDNEIEVPIKSHREIFHEILKEFGWKQLSIKDEIKKFEIFDEFEYELKSRMNRVMEHEESWKKIPNFNYSISNYGRIRNDSNGKIKSTRRKNFLIVVDLYKDGKRYMINVTRMEAELFSRHIEDNERVWHKDGDWRNNYIDNLKIVCM